MTQEFGHFGSIGAGACIDSWGAGPYVITINGKTFRFEDSDRFGPAIIKKNGDPTKNPCPSEKSPFWMAHELWVDQGRKTEADGITCIYEVISE